MDLRGYYDKVREVGKRLPEPCVVVSLETGDGGKPGVRTEVPRRIAAQMIVSGTARAATTEEARAFQDANLEAKRAADQLAAASRMQVTVIPSSEWRSLKGPGKPTKE
jgi:hypothetical protein